jgi:capsular exopolysaccharide synthesis family protein
MSYIFEALQRAENERAGGSPPKDGDSAAELLLRVEEDVERNRARYEERSAELPGDLESVAAMLQDVQGVEAEVAGPLFVEPVRPAAAAFELEEERSKGNGAAAAPMAVIHTAENHTATPRADGETESKPLVINAPAVAEAKPKPAGAATFATAEEVSSPQAVDSRLVCLTDQGSLAAEKFRVLGLKLRNLRDRRKLQRIVVTGTAPEEGKSLVAANLALNQSRSKILKTLLIDGDLRRPRVATRLGCDNDLPGLSECLRGERELTEVVYKLKGTRLWFLPAGRAPENPLELMQGGRLPELLDRLGKFFDWIIVDTPPVVPVADTTYWMKLADGVLMVIREGFSERKTVERALHSFDRSNLLGVVVNSCTSNDHSDYYSRYSQASIRTGAAVSPSAENE